MSSEIDLEAFSDSDDDSYRESEDSAGSLRDFIVSDSSSQGSSDPDYCPSESEFESSDQEEEDESELEALAASHLCQLCRMKICGKFEY